MTQTLDREARRAALLAARRIWGPAPEAETIAVRDLKVGDFVEQIPTQNGFRGIRCNAIVTSIEVEHDRYTRNNYYRGRRYPIESRAIRFKSAGDTGVSVPANHKVVVRRAVTS